MLIGCPKEIKTKEFRVGLTPTSVREYVRNGHQVIVETNAGAGIQASDDDYIRAGAKIVKTAKEVFDAADMIVKVKEPQPAETAMLRKDQILFTYLHLAADPVQAKGLIDSGCIAIAYETVTSDRGGLPLLAPMSEVAGRMGVHVGAYHLHAAMGGSGILIGGVPGVKAAEVVVLGGGVAGTHAAKMAVGMEARVTIIEKSLDRIRQLEDLFGNRANIIYSTQDSVEEYVSQADLVVGAVLIPGALAPKLITRELLKKMRPKSVIVDIAIDQGGCAETSKATTHDNPTYEVEGIVHYCVANMPGAVPMTSAQALNNAVLPYALALADKGWKRALLEDPNLKSGLNVCRGEITHKGVAESLNLPFVATPKDLAA
ncbi:MAG TPA: alanine dehydrogenase [Rhodospirillaceae bacterium]|nr:alanine dehydrogenase [Rhodospirillaceae bacterium]